MDKRIQVCQFASLPFIPDPELFRGIPLTSPMEQEKGSAVRVSVDIVEILNLLLGIGGKLLV